jgi:hypothetical protein
MTKQSRFTDGVRFAGTSDGCGGSDDVTRKPIDRIAGIFPKTDSTPRLPLRTDHAKQKRDP